MDGKANPSGLERLLRLGFRAFALACLAAAALAHAEAGFLDAEQAFRLRVDDAGGGKALLHWDIAPGYYLYRDRIAARGVSGGPQPVLEKPPGQDKDDPNFGRVAVYHDAVDVLVRAGSAAALDVSWQGCAEQGACYPPQHRSVSLQLASSSASQVTEPAAPAPASRAARGSTLVVGPFALPLEFLLLAACVALGWWTSERIARRRQLPLEGPLYLVLAAGLIAARLAFVVQYRAAYAAAPLAILDIRDGGWRPLAGFAAAALCVAVLSLRRKGRAPALAAGWGVSTGAWLAGMGIATALQAPAPGLPALTLPALDGTPVNLLALKGRPTVVNLWASWCPPCRREMPVLQQAQARQADVQFVFLDQGEPASRVQAFLAANGLVLRNVLLDAQGQAASAFGQRALPATLFFDARGRLVATRVGELSPATLAERLDALRPTATDPE